MAAVGLQVARAEDGGQRRKTEDQHQEERRERVDLEMDLPVRDLPGMSERRRRPGDHQVQRRRKAEGAAAGRRTDGDCARARGPPSGRQRANPAGQNEPKSRQNDDHDAPSKDA